MNPLSRRVRNLLVAGTFAITGAAAAGCDVIDSNNLPSVQVSGLPQIGANCTEQPTNPLCLPVPKQYNAVMQLKLQNGAVTTVAKADIAEVVAVEAGSPPKAPTGAKEWRVEYTVSGNQNTALRQSWIDNVDAHMVLAKIGTGAWEQIDPKGEHSYPGSQLVYVTILWHNKTRPATDLQLPTGITWADIIKLGVPNCIGHDQLKICQDEPSAAPSAS